VEPRSHAAKRKNSEAGSANALIVEKTCWWPHRGGHCHRDLRGISQGREIDEVRAVGEGLSHILGCGKSNPRVADSTRTDHGQQRDSVAQYEGAPPLARPPGL